MEVVINYTGKLPSVNHMYGRNRLGGMYLKPEGVQLKEAVVSSITKRLPKDVEVAYTLTVKGNWYNGVKGKTRIKKRDSNNLIKLIVDACCEGLGIDDSQIFEEEIIKKQSEVEGFRAEFYLLDI